VKDGREKGYSSELTAPPSLGTSTRPMTQLLEDEGDSCRGSSGRS